VRVRAAEEIPLLKLAKKVISQRSVSSDCCRRPPQSVVTKLGTITKNVTFRSLPHPRPHKNFSIEAHFMAKAGDSEGQPLMVSEMLLEDESYFEVRSYEMSKVSY